MKERRKHFLINKPLQFRYMAYIAITLIVVSSAMMANLYFGIWGSVLETFSDEQIRNDLLTASRIVEYEKARLTSQETSGAPLSFFKQADKLSLHQKEVFKNILDKTNRKIFLRFFLLLLLITWASIYLTHKIAGPIYRFRVGLSEIAQGNLTTRIRLRKADEAQSVAQQFNQAAEFLDRAFGRIKKIFREHKNDPVQCSNCLEEEFSKIKTSADA